MKNVFLLIDGTSMIKRLYYGYGPDFGPGCVLNKVNSLMKIFDNKMSTVYFVVDNYKDEETSFRREIFNQYKSGRDKIENFEQMMDNVLGFLVSKNINVRIAPSFFEADDVIGTMARELSYLKKFIIIHTGDYDFLQLVKPWVMVYLDPPKKDNVLYYNSKFKDKIGIYAYQYLDYKTLVGDNSDRLQGVKGIGPKTAIKLLQKYDTLEKVILRSDNIKEEDRQGLLKELIIQRDIMRIRENLDLNKIYKL